MIRNSVTIYGTHHGASATIRALSGDLQQVSMWNMITNVLRIMNAIITALGTAEDEYYITADDCYYIVKTE